MRLIAFLMLLWGGCVASLYAESATVLPAGFPTAEVHNFETLHAEFNFAPYTTAQFEQVRTMPSGRVLRSRGTFEFRRGVGMMWRTDSPARTAMIISRNSLVIYGSKGQELRRADLSGSPVARYTTVFLDGAEPDSMAELTRAFKVTYHKTAGKTVLGLQAKRDAMDLRMLLVEVVKGEVRRVEYESARQGRTVIQFKAVKNGAAVPQEPFKILLR